MIEKSVDKTEKLITVEDHNPYNGLSAGLLRHLAMKGIDLEQYRCLGVTEYQLSGKPLELYAAAGIDAANIVKTARYWRT